MASKKEQAYATVAKEKRRLADKASSKPKESGWVAKLKSDVTGYFKAKKSTRKMKKVGKKIKKRMDAKDGSPRSKGIAGRLRDSGMNEDQIKRLRGR